MKNELEFTDEQKSIFKFVKEGVGNGIIEAVAGSGKSTTLVEALNYVPSNKSVLFTAFNKDIVNELQEKVIQNGLNNVEVQTLHSLGFRALKRNNSETKLDGKKMYPILAALLKEYGTKKFEEDTFGQNLSSSDSQKIRLASLDYFDNYKEGIFRTVNYIQNNNVDFNSFNQIEKAFKEVCIDEPYMSFVAEITKKIFERHLSNPELITFNDMIWLPVYSKIKMDSYDFIFVDECQDLNKTQRDLIKLCCHENTRVIMVGDSYQAIYAFRGADKESMLNFKDEFNADNLYLSYSFRCPKKVVGLAQEYSPHIKALDSARDGDVVFDMLYFELVNTIDYGMVLSRTNSPLLKLALDLSKRKKKVYVSRGLELKKSLIKRISELESSYDYLGCRVYLQKHIDRLEYEASTKEVGKDKIMVELDMHKSLLFLVNNSYSFSALRNTLNLMLQDKCDADIICSTIHSAKGLEADMVYLLEFDKIPHKYAKTEIELQQEMNLKYVGVTRSRDTLVFVDK